MACAAVNGLTCFYIALEQRINAFSGARAKQKHSIQHRQIQNCVHEAE